MWYFTWILGLTAAILLAAMNAMWYEAQENKSAGGTGDQATDAPSSLPGKEMGS